MPNVCAVFSELLFFLFLKNNNSNKIQKRPPVRCGGVLSVSVFKKKIKENPNWVKDGENDTPWNDFLSPAGPLERRPRLARVRRRGLATSGASGSACSSTCCYQKNFFYKKILQEKPLGCFFLCDCFDQTPSLRSWVHRRLISLINQVSSKFG